MNPGKCQNPVCNLSGKKKYFIHIKALKQALDHGIMLENVNRVIEFDKETWFKPYKDMNKELKTKAKIDFEKDVFKLMSILCLENLLKM